MLLLNKYKLFGCLSYKNSFKKIRYLNQNIKPINVKNFYSIDFDCNFYNLFLRTFIYFFFIMYSYNHFTILYIKDSPHKTIKLQFGFLNFVSHYYIDKVNRSNY